MLINYKLKLLWFVFFFYFVINDVRYNVNENMFNDIICKCIIYE